MTSECANWSVSVVYRWWCARKITSNITVSVAVYRLAGRIFSRKIMDDEVLNQVMELWFGDDAGNSICGTCYRCRSGAVELRYQLGVCRVAS